MQDKQYVALRKKAASQTGDERKQTLNAQAQLLEGKSIGKVIQDMQALKALIALMQHNAEYFEQKGLIHAENGSEVETSFQTKAAASYYKAQQLENEKVFASIDVSTLFRTQV
jgi:hypothetical protein